MSNILKRFIEYSTIWVMKEIRLTLKDSLKENFIKTVEEIYEPRRIGIAKTEKSCFCGHTDFILNVYVDNDNDFGAAMFWLGNDFSKISSQ